MTIRTTLLTSTAALALLAVSATSAQAQLEVNYSGSVAFTAGYWEDDLPPIDEDDFGDFAAESDITIRYDGVADNGLAYSATIDFDPKAFETDTRVDDLLVPADDASAFLTQIRRDISCPPNAFVERAWTDLVARFISDDQGVLATETPTPTFVNPGYDIKNTLGGYQVSAGLGFCSDIWNLPTHFSLGVDYGSYSNEVVEDDIPFPEGLGITGTGEIPGVFINSDTLLNTLEFQASREAWSSIFQVDQPVLIKGVINPGKPSFGFEIGVLGGFRVGGFREEQHLNATTTTPAFGAASGAVIDYDTLFNGSFFGAFAGTSLTHTASITPRLSISNRIAIAFGYDAYAIDVDDSVTATGLGGALNFASTNGLHYNVGTPTASAQLTTGFNFGNFSIFGYTGIDVGRDPDLDYVRVDSIGGAAANPTLNLGLKPNWEIGIGASYQR